MSLTYGETVDAICNLTPEQYSLARACGIINDTIIDMTITMGFKGCDIIEELESKYQESIKDN